MPGRLKPYIFVGSSSAAKPFAEEVITRLNDVAVPIGWWDVPEFTNGRATLDGLLKAVDTYDFAVFLLTADDECTSRGETRSVPRDNVLFEYGLFLGFLRQGRTLAFVQSGALKLPSDVSGIHLERFTVPSDFHERIAAASKLAGIVKKEIANADDWWKLQLGDVISSWSIVGPEFRVTLMSAPLRARPSRFRGKELILVIRQKDDYKPVMDDERIMVGKPRKLTALDSDIRLKAESRELIGSAPIGTVIEARVFVVPPGVVAPVTIGSIISQGGKLVCSVQKTIPTCPPEKKG